jgi:hypothetical protein
MRLGDVILIVDSDTFVVEECLGDAARELAESPEVGIIEHGSEVMLVVLHCFQGGIPYFTRRINRSISMVCPNSEVAAFVGHNEFLRWSAIQDAIFVDPIDGMRKIWSENNNVSEDFDFHMVPACSSRATSHMWPPIRTAATRRACSSRPTMRTTDGRTTHSTATSSSSI